MTNEHMVSKSFFSDLSEHVTVKGFWDNEERIITPNNLQKRCLCAAHNHKLGVELDQECGKIFSYVEEMHKLAVGHLQKIEPVKDFDCRTYEINAALLERWLLKTLINIFYEKNDKKLYFSNRQLTRNIPFNDLVSIVFGRLKFHRYNGLFFAKGGMHNTLDTGQNFSMIPVRCELDDLIIGCAFLIRGLFFYLDISSVGFLGYTDLANKLGNRREGLIIDGEFMDEFLGEEWKGKEFIRPCRNFRFYHPEKFSYEINFLWPSE